MFPNCKCVRASTRGGGLKLKTACKHCIHNLMFGGLEVRKFSASPKSDKYQASWDDAMSLLKTLHPFLPHFINGSAYFLNCCQRIEILMVFTVDNNNKLQKRNFVCKPSAIATFVANLQTSIHP